MSAPASPRKENLTWAGTLDSSLPGTDSIWVYGALDEGVFLTASHTDNRMFAFSTVGGPPQLINQINPSHWNIEDPWAVNDEGLIAIYGTVSPQYVTIPYMSSGVLTYTQWLITHPNISYIRVSGDSAEVILIDMYGAVFGHATMTGDAVWDTTVDPTWIPLGSPHAGRMVFGDNTNLYLVGSAGVLDTIAFPAPSGGVISVYGTWLVADRRLIYVSGG